MSKVIRKDIQALRAIAVGAVVIYHLWPNRLMGGFIGVDIFFVISGYLMTVSLMKGVGPVVDAPKGKRIRASLSFLSEFYARRIKRLIPAAAVTLTGVTGLVLLTKQLDLIERTTEQVAASALFVQNWLLASESVNYLAASEAPTAVQHFWSLSLEEQFYLIWPLTLIAIGFITTNLFILYRGKKINGALLPILLLAGAFFIYGYLLTKSDPAAAYFVTPARVWELILGGVLAFLPLIKNTELKLLLPWFGATLCAYSLFYIDASNFPGWQALVPTIGTMLIIYAGSDKDTARFSFNNMLRFKPIQWIGDISYSLYLWHWPLIVLIPVLLAVDINGEYGKFIKLGILALSVFVAWLSYRFVEQTSLRAPLKKYQVYLAFVAIVTVVAGGSLLISNHAKVTAQNNLKQLHSIALSDEECFGARSISNDTCESSFGNVNKSWGQLVKADASLILIPDGRYCDYYRIGEQDDPTKYCEYGEVLNPKTTIVVWGDSHSDHWLNALNQIGERNKIKFVHFSSATCAVDEINATKCQARINFIKQTGILKDADSILFSTWMNGDPRKIIEPYEFLEANSDAPVYIIQDIPEGGESGGNECLYTKKSCKNPIGPATTKVTQTLVPIIGTNKLVDNKQLIETFDFFCDTESCYSYIGGVSVYRDSDKFGNSHISSAYAISLSSALERKLKAAGAIK